MKKVDMDVLNDLLDSSAAEGLWAGIDKSTSGLLSKLGVNELSLDSLMDITPRRVVALVFDIASGKLSAVSKYIFILLGIIIFISLIDSFIDRGSGVFERFNNLYLLFFILALISPLLSCVSDVLSAIRLSADFSLLLIPVFAGIVTASGNPMLAVTYNSLTFTAAQMITRAAANYMPVLVGVNLSLCVAGAVNPLFDTAGIMAAVKKIFSVSASLFSTLFFGLLSVKGLLAGAADSLSVRGTKFFIGTFVPVIGGSLSEGMSSILSSVSLLNSVVGVFGIILISLIILPAVIEAAVWWLALQFCLFACTLLGKDNLARFIGALSGLLAILNVFLIFVGAVFIVSIGLTLSLRKN